MGGTFTAMNKVRPGIYINFATEAGVPIAVSERGIVLMPVSANWGEVNKAINIYSIDMTDGTFEKLLGDTDRLLYELVLSNCNQLVAYRVNSGGAKATITLGELTATARYTGTFGNKIAVGVSEDGVVTTYVNNLEVDSQTVENYSALLSNDYVSFSGTGAPSEQASTTMTGGANGSTNTYTQFFNDAQRIKFNTLATVDSSINADVETLVKNMVEKEGKYVQAVIAVANMETKTDYENIIQVVQPLTLNTTEVTPVQITAYVAGITAGAEITQSNTFKVTPFTAIPTELTNSEVIKALNNGNFLFTPTADGGVKVEKDINSFINITASKGYKFSKNRPLRVINEIGNTMLAVWEKSYGGKIDGTDRGRAIFKADMITYLNNLQSIGAITEFDPSDITVVAGTNDDEAIATLRIKPVDAIEKMYMNVNLR